MVRTQRRCTYTASRMRTAAGGASNPGRYEAMTVQQRLDKQGPRKLLAIDGGGIRGALALGVLEKIEQDLRDRSGRRDLVLADYFDYIAGTSTGGVIAAGLAVGRTVEDVLRFYQ